jgi:peptidoglycan L-alanyl-D-glutamate endopeptidase CwlK
VRKWSARSLGNLEGIHPDLRRVMDRALQESPLDFIVIEGLRSEARQRELVASGASRTMNSRHLTGHAVDLLPIGPNGKAEFAWPLYHNMAPAIKEAARKEGVPLAWGGDWKSFKDGPHFELERKAYPAGQAWTMVKHKPVADQPLATKPVDVSEPAQGDRQNWLAAILALVARIIERWKA